MPLRDKPPPDGPPRNRPRPKRQFGPDGAITLALSGLSVVKHPVTKLPAAGNRLK